MLRATHRRKALKGVKQLYKMAVAISTVNEANEAFPDFTGFTAVAGGVLSSVTSNPSPSTPDSTYVLKCAAGSTGGGVTYIRRPNSSPTDYTAPDEATYPPGRYRFTIDVYYGGTNTVNAKFYDAITNNFAYADGDGPMNVSNSLGYQAITSIPTNTWFTMSFETVYYGGTGTNDGYVRFWVSSAFAAGDYFGLDNFRVELI